MVCCWIYPIAAAGSCVGALNLFFQGQHDLILGILAHACNMLLLFVGPLKFSASNDLNNLCRPGRDRRSETTLFHHYCTMRWDISSFVRHLMRWNLHGPHFVQITGLENFQLGAEAFRISHWSLVC